MSQQAAAADNDENCGSCVAERCVSIQVNIAMAREEVLRVIGERAPYKGAIPREDIGRVDDIFTTGDRESINTLCERYPGIEETIRKVQALIPSLYETGRQACETDQQSEIERRAGNYAAAERRRLAYRYDRDRFYDVLYDSLRQRMTGGEGTAVSGSRQRKMQAALDKAFGGLVMVLQDQAADDSGEGGVDRYIEKVRSVADDLAHNNRVFTMRDLYADDRIEEFVDEILVSIAAFFLDTSDGAVTGDFYARGREQFLTLADKANADDDGNVRDPFTDDEFSVLFKALFDPWFDALFTKDESRRKKASKRLKLNAGGQAPDMMHVLGSTHRAFEQSRKMQKQAG